MAPTPLLEEQYAELLLRFRRHELPITAAIAELHRLAGRALVVDDVELRSLLARVDHAHMTGSLNTHPSGSWTGAPTGRAIAVTFGIGKRKLRVVRDAYYTLHLGLCPYDADESLAV